MKRAILILLFLAVFLGGLIILLNGKKTTTMKDVRPDLDVEAVTLYSDFHRDEAAANEMYLNKVVRVEGRVVSVDPAPANARILLAGTGDRGGLICTLDPLTEHRRQEFHAGEVISLKCVVTGFHNEVVLNNCVEL